MNKPKNTVLYPWLIKTNKTQISALKGCLVLPYHTILKDKMFQWFSPLMYKLKVVQITSIKNAKNRFNSPGNTASLFKDHLAPKAPVTYISITPAFVNNIKGGQNKLIPSASNFY